MNTTYTRRDSRRSTPWGTADDVCEYAPGILFYSTPSHGGFLLGAKRNAQVPAALRLDDGVYEEDCEYARVLLAFPDVFTEADRAAEHYPRTSSHAARVVALAQVTVGASWRRVYRETLMYGRNLVARLGWEYVYPDEPGYADLH